MAGTKEGAKKAMLTKLKKDPEVFSKMGKKGKKGGKHSSGSFTSETASRAGKVGGAKGKRSKSKRLNGKSKRILEARLEDYKLEYEDIPFKRRFFK